MITLSSPSPRCQNLLTSDQFHLEVAPPRESNRLSCDLQLSRLCTSCGQVWLRTILDPLRILTPQNSKGSLGSLDKVTACLWKGRRTEQSWGWRVLNSLSSECPKMFRLFQRLQVSTSPPQGFCDLEGSPGAGSPVVPPLEFKSLTYSYKLVCRFQKSPKRLGEGKVKMKDVTALF